MESCHIVFNLLMISCLFGWCCSAGQCMFEYTHQPPSTTLEDCRPYRQNWLTISLDCTVRYQTNEFEKKWFMENTAGVVKELGHGDPDKSLDRMHWFSRYHINQQYNSSYLGKYWCQVINTAADPDQPLMRSNVFTLLAPEDYTLPTCVSNQSTRVQTVDNVTCADLSVQTTSPAPTNELSSYVNSLNSAEFQKSSCWKILDCTTPVDIKQTTVPSTTDIDSTTVSELLSTANSTTTLSILVSVTDIDPTITVVPLQTPHLSVADLDPTMSTSAVPSSEMQSTILAAAAAGVSTVALLLLVIIVSSLLIVILLVQRRRRKYLVNGKNNDYSDIITQQSLETTESMFSHEPVAYEVPVVSTKKQQQQPDAAQYSVVKPVNNNSNNGDNKRDEDGNTLCLSTPPTLVYMTGCAAAAGGLDHQYSSLNHQVLPASTHDDQCSEQEHERDADAVADSDGQYSKLKIDIYNQFPEDDVN